MLNERGKKGSQVRKRGELKRLHFEVEQEGHGVLSHGQPRHIRTPVPRERINAHTLIRPQGGKKARYTHTHTSLGRGADQ